MSRSVAQMRARGGITSVDLNERTIMCELSLAVILRWKQALAGQIARLEKGRDSETLAVFRADLRRLERVLPPAGTPDDRFTDVEVRTLQLLAEGMPREQIAAVLTEADDTTKSRLARIYRRLGAANAASAVCQAMREGIIK